MVAFLMFKFSLNCSRFSQLFSVSNCCWISNMWNLHRNTESPPLFKKARCLTHWPRIRRVHTILVLFCKNPHSVCHESNYICIVIATYKPLHSTNPCFQIGNKQKTNFRIKNYETCFVSTPRPISLKDK